MGAEAALEEAPPVLKRAVATLRVGAGGTSTASKFWAETTAMAPASAPAPPSLGRGGEANSVEVPLMSRDICSASSGPAITARNVEESELSSIGELTADNLDLPERSGQCCRQTQIPGEERSTAERDTRGRPAVFPLAGRKRRSEPV